MIGLPTIQITVHSPDGELVFTRKFTDQHKNP